MLPRRVSRTVARSLIVRQSRSTSHFKSTSPTIHPSSIARRSFSDRLMGYSPMSPDSPNTPQGESRMPTAKEVTTAGGVWAPTSAKRDKLAELKIELTEEQDNLDDAATPDQLQDLYLVDGLQLIAKGTDSLADDSSPAINQISEWLVEQQVNLPEEMDKDKWQAHLEVVQAKIETFKSQIDVSACLRDVRDYLDPTSLEDFQDEVAQLSGASFDSQNDAFAQAVLLFRMQLMEASIEHFLNSWDACTTVSDADVDRAATQGLTLEPQAETLPTVKVYKYMFSHLSGSCSDRVDAAWDLIDKDNDDMLDESEMAVVTELCVAPVQVSLARVFDLALNQEPVTDADLVETAEPAATKGWRQRRREARHQKRITKMLDKAIQNHFVDEVEMPHRLRCIYAWAEKAHQGNKIESIMVEAAGWSDRKRYVELSPKISLAEFREVQQEHFTHLDRIGTEILKSYREDLWVLQGKGRERGELIRDSTLFLTGVSIADYLILAS